MKILNKREIQQTSSNHLPGIDFKDFIKIYKKCTGEPYSFSVNETILPSDNPLRFRKNLLKWICSKLWHDDQIKDGKKQYYINTEAAKISALLSEKIDK